MDEDATGERRIVRSIKVKEYLRVPPHKARLYLTSVSSDDIQVSCNSRTVRHNSG